MIPCILKGEDAGCWNGVGNIGIGQEKAFLLAAALDGLADLAEFKSKGQNTPLNDKEYRLKLLLEEFNFRKLSAELRRLNQHGDEERETFILASRAGLACGHLEEYINNNLKELYMFVGRLYTLKHACSLFESESGENVPNSG